MFIALGIIICSISSPVVAGLTPTCTLSSSLLVPLPTQLIFQSSLFLENIAVRTSSDLLLTSVESSTLHNLNPFTVNGTLAPVHTFSNSTAISGIAEYRPGVFAVVASVLNTTIRRAVPGSVVLWSVDFNQAVAAVNKIGTLPDLTGANGLTSIPDAPDTLLAADSASGAVWQMNTRTGASRLVIQDPSMLPGAPAPALGINGLHVHGGFLYFTNSQLGTFSRVPLKIESDEVSTEGPVQLLATTTGQSPDDFAIDTFGRAWTALHPGALDLVFPAANGTWSTLDIVGNLLGNNSALNQPTSAAFGRGDLLQTQMLYVTTAAGQVVRVDTTC
ncbi:hypothetical protein DFH07DRAFT_70660 [Mycena maculata]|uniref:SMP-30/Gluconolactonase/LRE-like region domain-containing protein n=1 Tax=Mycena maculata TaxID=230809 RepID=A0AAD7MZJ7_9AGAR|nr:hypothetical protein DFH07DRAFT_70660 [Mycena maculata]